MNTITATVIFLAIILATFFNLLVRKRNQVEFALGTLGAQLQRRHDLIPNLVSICEKYMGYEAEVLQALTMARAKSTQEDSAPDATVERSISSGLRSVLAVAENYPSLRAEAEFDHLQRSLNEVEEQLVASRRAYNAAVMTFNNTCQMFPSNVLAAVMGFKTRVMFEVDTSDQLPTRVWR
jgi:LemA protein